MHFLRKDEARRARNLGRPHAAVVVQLTAQRPRVLEVQRLTIMRADVELVALPLDVEVRSPEGEVIRPSKGRIFAVSVETFDPFHLVTELPDAP